MVILLFNLESSVYIRLWLYHLQVKVYGAVLWCIRSVAQTFMLSQSASDPVPSDRAVAALTEDEDDVYFGSYGHFSIHEDMLKVSHMHKILSSSAHML